MYLTGKNLTHGFRLQRYFFFSSQTSNFSRKSIKLPKIIYIPLEGKQVHILHATKVKDWV